MDLTIVVVTFNSERFVRKCLGSLQMHQPKELDFEIVVIDNASGDKTVEIIKAEFPQITLIENDENLGFGSANNIAMAAAPARYYYLHNADAYLQDDILDRAVMLMDENPRLGVAGLPLVFPDLSPQTSAYSFTTPVKWALQGLGVPTIARRIATSPNLTWLRKPLSRLPVARSYMRTHSGAEKAATQITPVDWICGASMILREKTRRDLDGGFDPAIFLYGEDEDLCIQAQKAGWHVAQLPVTPVIHEFGWGSTGKSSKTVARLKANSLRVFIDKHYANRPISRWAMRAMLWVKRKRWGVA